MLPINFHAYSKDEHVGFIENAVKFIKERVICVCYTVPYRKYTILTTRSLIEGVIDILNLFPSENGISEDLGPSTIVEGRQKLDLSKKRLEFGAYFRLMLGHQTI